MDSIIEEHEEHTHAEEHSEAHDKPKKWLITPNQMSIGGKVLGIILAFGAGVLAIFTEFNIDLDAINKTSWTLAFLGAPVDASYIFSNLGTAFKRH